MGKYPGVLIWPDIFGNLRPTFKEMATRLAEIRLCGSSVINPVLSHPKSTDGGRPTPIFNDPANASGSLMNPGPGTLEGSRHRASPMPRHFHFRFLDGQPIGRQRKTKKIGTTGYCMGGPFVFRTAAHLSGPRSARGHTFHGGWSRHRQAR